MRKVLNLTVLIASLGYFVDMFDLTVFGVVRISSLQSIGVSDPQELTRAGIMLINSQAAGMLIGGLWWGILADKKGRLSVLFGSILLYSLANSLNAFVTSVDQYAVLRFIAGIGLAGELGSAVTLVAETLGKTERGYGTTVVAALGLLGAVAASLVGQLLPWKFAYLVGGGLGFLLLLARFKLSDSQVFKNLHTTSSRGDLRIFLSGGRFKRYLYCIALGVPVYFITGILLTFSPEIAGAMGLKNVTAGNALLMGSIGLTIGDVLSGLLSQYLQSRKKAIMVSLLSATLFGLGYYLLGGVSNFIFYAACFCLGMSGGYWAVLVTVAAEQFGTNIRATVATSVPNFVRASVIPLTFLFSALRGSFGIIGASAVIGVSVIILALIALHQLAETFGRDLVFVEVRHPHLVAEIAPEKSPETGRSISRG